MIRAARRRNAGVDPNRDINLTASVVSDYRTDEAKQCLSY
jgi:hypothetical protein